MKRLRAVLRLALMLGWSGLAAAQAPPPPVDLDAPAANTQKERIADRLGQGGAHAFVLGVSEFRSPAWQRLSGVIDEVRDVAAALRLHGFAVQTLHGDASATTTAMIQSRLDAFINERRAGERVLIYIASHGLAVPSSAGTKAGESIGYVIGSDTPASTDPAFAARALSVDRIKQALDRLPSQHVMVAFNTCFSGSLVPATRAEAHRPDLPARPATAPLSPEVDDWIATLMAGRARHFLTAGDAEQTVPDADNPFGRAFVEALMGAGDSDGDGLLLASEIGQFVRARVALETRRAGRPNDPLFITDRNGPGIKDGEFVLLSPRGPAGSEARKDGQALERRRAGLGGGQFTDCLDCPVMIETTAVAEAGQATAQKPAALARTEVTAGEWAACFRAGQCRRYKPETAGSNRPVTHVTWGDALDYLDFLNAAPREGGRCTRYRLPGASEWSRAAFGGASSRYPWGDGPAAGRAVCQGCGSPFDGQAVAAAGSLAPNGFGLHEMAGNAWEWLADAGCGHEAYAAGQCTAGQVIGGGFTTDLAQIDLRRSVPVARPGPRAGLPEPGWPSIGLRVACDLDAVP